VYSIIHDRALINLLFLDSDGVEFVILSLHNKQWHFEAATCEEKDEWVAAIEQQILNSLQVSILIKTLLCYIHSLRKLGNTRI
jgi:hypothetical protein